MANSILNSDDGAVSGSAGLKFTAGDDGVLKIQNNGTDALTLNSSGAVTFDQPLAAPLSMAGGFSFRNKLINGNFDIWQRATSQTSNGYGSADRWSCVSSGSTKTASRQAFTLGQTDVPNNPKYFMRHVVTSSAGASSRVNMDQRIEGVETLAGQTATLSFWAKADASKNIAVEFAQYFGSGGSPSAFNSFSSQLVALTTSWTKYTVTVNIPSVSGKTLGTDGNDYLYFNFWFDAGSDFNSRAASLGQQSGTFDIAQVQIEEGSAATSFEIRPLTVEEQLCFRYYYKIQPGGVGFVLSEAAGSSTTTRGWGMVTLPVPMRITPSAMETTGTPSDYRVYLPGVNAWAGTTGPTYTSLNTNKKVIFYLDTAGTHTVASASNIAANTTAAFLAWSAEL